MKYRRARGTADIFADDAKLWQYVEMQIRDICNTYNYSEIRTPIFEHTEIFTRSVGEHTDIVEKEMYTFEDKSNRSLTLRPEGTASIVRAFLENKIYAEAQPTKLYYVGPMFRYEKPQAGRMRQFHQFGVEVFASESALADAEVISLNLRVLEKFNIKKIKLLINSIGCKSCRPIYNKALVEFVNSKKDDFCSLCKERIDKNPLRVLDCKNESCQNILKEAPTIDEFLDDDCKKHFEDLQMFLNDMNIEFEISNKLVRGLDYYNRTVFEFVSEDIGTQGTICGGGRYDGLISEFSGDDSPGVGFAIGLERLIILIKASDLKIEEKEKKNIFIVSIGEKANKFANSLVYKLRSNGVQAELDLLLRSVRAQLKQADRLNVRYSCVIGDNELEEEILSLRDMQSGEEKKLSFDELIEYMINENK